MSLTLELPPELEARMRTNAAVHGKDVADYLLTLPRTTRRFDLTEFEGMADFQASVAALSAGLADLDAGRTISLEQMAALLEERVPARDVGGEQMSVFRGQCLMALPSEESIIWTIRFRNRASDDIQAVEDYFVETAGEDFAQFWSKGFIAEVAKLAQFPTIWPVAEIAGFRMTGWRKQPIGDLPLYQARTIAWLPRIVQGFTTRHGGRQPAAL